MSDLVVVHAFEEFLAVFLVEFHEHVGLLLLVGNQVEEPFRLPQIEILEELGDIGGVHVVDLSDDVLAVLAVDLVDDAFYVFVGEFFHCSRGLYARRPDGPSGVNFSGQ